MPVLDAIDRSLARDYGRAPGELDHLALGAVGMMQAEALVKSRRRERERLALAGLVVDGLLNYGGMRGADFKPHPFGWHLAKWTGDEVPKPPPPQQTTRGEMEDIFRRFGMVRLPSGRWVDPKRSEGAALTRAAQPAPGGA